MLKPINMANQSRINFSKNCSTMAPEFARNGLLDNASLHPGDQAGTDSYIHVLDYLVSVSKSKWTTMLTSNL